MLPLPYANNWHSTTYWFADTLTAGAPVDLHAPGFVARATPCAIRLLDADETVFQQYAPLLVMTDTVLRARLKTRGRALPDFLCGGPADPDQAPQAWEGFVSCPAVRRFEDHPALSTRSFVRMLGVFAQIAAALDVMERGESADYRYDLGTYGVIWLSLETTPDERHRDG